MERVPVSSSNLRSVGYDAESSTLEIEFHAGSVYQYHGVPPSEHEALMNAGSIGSYFNTNIKNRFAVTKL